MATFSLLKKLLFSEVKFLGLCSEKNEIRVSVYLFSLWTPRRRVHSLLGNGIAGLRRRPECTGLFLAATHLGSPELLPPCPLRSAFSAIFRKPGALPFPLGPEGERVVSGRKPWRPAFWLLGSLGARPSYQLPPRPAPPCSPLRPVRRSLQWAASRRLGPGSASAITGGPRSGAGVRLSLWPVLFLRV